MPRACCGRRRVVLDLGLTFLAAVARDPDALAIVDHPLRLTYAQWYERISALAAGLGELGLAPGDHLVTLLQNRWEAATLHWACQLTGVIITPINWRAKPDELDFCLEDAKAKALVYEGISAQAVARSKAAQTRQRVALEGALASDVPFQRLAGRSASGASRGDAEQWSVMLYTSGTTARPKGVPRRQRTERAAAVAHVAQN